jgi:hypothetical protein
VKPVDEKGKAIPFYETMIYQALANELRNITGMMSGEGTNRGKLRVSIRHGEEGRQFEEFPGKFKEYFESVISLDKRADQVIPAGKGISSSVTNVENDGVTGKSGSDVYYNYLIYVNALGHAEYFVMKEINRAIRMNFPDAWRDGVRPGFRIDILVKFRETSPADRLGRTAAPDAKSALHGNADLNDE